MQTIAFIWPWRLVMSIGCYVLQLTCQGLFTFSSVLMPNLSQAWTKEYGLCLWEKAWRPIQKTSWVYVQAIAVFLASSDSSYVTGSVQNVTDMSPRPHNHLSSFKILLTTWLANELTQPLNLPSHARTRCKAKLNSRRRCLSLLQADCLLVEHLRKGDAMLCD